MGRRAWMSDINRASIQVTLGKTAALTSREIVADMRRLASELVWEGILVSDDVGENGEGGDRELGEWFHADTLRQLHYLWKVVESASVKASRQVLEMLFADTLFSCAGGGDLTTKTGKRRRHHWGWIADNVRPPRTLRRDAIRIFRLRLNHAIEVIEGIPPLNNPSIAVRRDDARRLDREADPAALVVTSPPYLGMIDYSKANRLTYLWMGWDLGEDKSLEIGARYRRHGQQTAEKYFADMAQCAEAISASLISDGHCALVIGASRKHPTAAEHVIRLFAKHFDLVWGPRERTPTRRRVGDRAGTEPKELLCVLRKCG